MNLLGSSRAVHISSRHARSHSIERALHRTDLARPNVSARVAAVSVKREVDTIAYDGCMTYSVGLRSESIAEIPTLIFYPTQASERLERLGPFTIDVARDAPVHGGRLPLVV